MRGSFGEHFRLSIFGESHGDAIGIVIDGVPAGFQIDEEEVAFHMHRRAPGHDPSSSPRREADRVRILSGVLNGYATGAPICGLIENTNTRSSDYKELARLMRPGHADYAGYVKYRGFNDPRGGGHFSGRLTAPLVFAGSIARQLLSAHGITIGAHIASIGETDDVPFDPVRVSSEVLDSLHHAAVPLLDPSLEATIRAAIADAKASGDSIGGSIECAACGVPAGIGSPFFGSLESVFSQLAFSVPAVKSVSFGSGEAFAHMRGSTANAALCMADGRVTTLTNHNGGVTGGITNGMPVLLRVTVKPTPSIALPQSTVDVTSLSDAFLEIKGRHDPCIVLRAVPVIESVLAIALTELMMDNRSLSL